MHEIVTTLLDVLGLLALAIGAAAMLWPLLGLGCLVVGGVIVLLGARVADGWAVELVAKARHRKAKA